MEKVSGFIKGIFATFMELLLHPVSKVSELVQKEDIKKGAIKGVILAFSLALINVLLEIRSLKITFGEWDALFDSSVEAFRPIATLFKTFAINIVGIVIVALVLFVIAKLLKDQKSITYTISMIVNSAAVYTVALLIGLIIGLIPGVFGTGVASLIIAAGKTHACLTLIVSFVSSLANIDIDKLILVSLVTFAVVGISSMIFDLITSEKSLEDFTTSKFMSYPKYYAAEPKDIDMSDSLSGLNALNSLSSLSALSSLY